MSDFTRANQFPNTRWTMVARSTEADDTTRQKALSELCELYWPPIYAFIRSKGNSPHDAEDLAQGFFASVLARQDIGKTDASKGKLRSFFLASVKNYMANEHRKNTRQKRGSGQAVLSLNLDEAETRFHVPEPRDDNSPDKVYQQQWVMTLLSHVLENLGTRYEKDGKGELFKALKPALTPGAPMAPYSELAPTLGLSESALKVAVHRLKQRYGTLLRETIADTLGPDEDPEEELGQLMTVFE